MSPESRAIEDVQDVVWRAIDDLRDAQDEYIRTVALGQTDADGHTIDHEYLYWLTDDEKSCEFGNEAIGDAIRSLLSEFGERPDPPGDAA